MKRNSFARMRARLVAPDPATVAAQGELLDLFNAAIGRLPTKQRTALQMTINGDSSQQIAAKLDVCVGSVRHLLCRARGAVRLEVPVHG